MTRPSDDQEAGRAIFLGAHSKGGPPATLEEAARWPSPYATGQDSPAALERLAARDDILQRARNLSATKKRKQKYLRGLFSGGTFCAEAQIIFDSLLKDVYSNAPAGKTKNSSRIR